MRDRATGLDDDDEDDDEHDKREHEIGGHVGHPRC